MKENYILSCDICASRSGCQCQRLGSDALITFRSTQEVADGVLRPAEDVCRDQAELAAGEGHVVRRRVLPLAHRQQRDLPALRAGRWRPKSGRKKPRRGLLQAV